MNFLFLIIAIAIVFVVGSHIYTTVTISRLRQSGAYPMAGKATMADVERLKTQGLSVWAARCYREIHGCSLRQAKESVQNLG
jgi:ABC-type uncharacterized transport system permease subunit